MDEPEDTDQQPDFRLLLTNKKRNPAAAQELPSRTSKAAVEGDTQAHALDDQYDAYFQILQEERRAAERTYSRASYEPDLGLFRLTTSRGTHFVSMGHTIQGQIYLFPEEALFLVDRGSLITERQGVEMTVQQMWSVYLSQPGVRGESASLAMDRYVTYAYLKRLGFVVTRPGIYFAQEANENGSETCRALLPATESIWLTLAQMSWNTVWNLTGGLLSRVGLWMGGLLKHWGNASTRPLVGRAEQLSYDAILQRLQIIPSTRLSDVSSTALTEGQTRTKFDFEIYKPSGAFRKRQPGTPDYRLVVVKADAAFHGLERLKDLFRDQYDPVQDLNAQVTAFSKKGAKTKGPEYPRALFAIVDGGQVTFLDMFNIKAVP